MPAAEADQSLVAVFDTKTSRSSSVAVHFHPDVVDDSESPVETRAPGRGASLGDGISETRQRMEEVGKRFSTSLTSSLSYYVNKAKESRDSGRGTVAPRLTAFTSRVQAYAGSPQAVRVRGSLSAWCERETMKLRVDMRSVSFWRALFGEFLGTLMLVVIGCGVASVKVGTRLIF